LHDEVIGGIKSEPSLKLSGNPVLTFTALYHGGWEAAFGTLQYQHIQLLANQFKLEPQSVLRTQGLIGMYAGVEVGKVLSHAAASLLWPAGTPP
jgi:hypothetical protein